MSNITFANESFISKRTLNAYEILTFQKRSMFNKAGKSFMARRPLIFESRSIIRLLDNSSVGLAHSHAIHLKQLKIKAILIRIMLLTNNFKNMVLKNKICIHFHLDLSNFRNCTASISVGNVVLQRIKICLTSFCSGKQNFDMMRFRKLVFY